MIYSLLGFYLNWRAYDFFGEGHSRRWEVTDEILFGMCTIRLKYQLDFDESGYTARHLHWRIANIAEHRYSAIGKHLLDAHGDKNLINEDQFRFLKKCHGKFDCLVYDKLFIKELRPSLNTQSDSICVLNCLFSLCHILFLSFLINYCFLLY